MSNADVDFQAQHLQWRSYITRDVLPTTKQVKLIGKIKFTVVALDPKYKAFIIYIVALSVDPGNEMQCSKRVQIAYLKADEAPFKVPSKYADFADVFSLKLVIKLPKNTRINDHAIKFVDNWQSPYGPIYSLSPIELETLKAYIKNNLINGFIRPFKSLTRTLILFNKKPDGSLRLCIDYRGLNNLTIKNWYPLPLVGESLDQLGQAQRFIQLDLTNAYH